MRHIYELSVWYGRTPAPWTNPEALQLAVETSDAYSERFDTRAEVDAEIEKLEADPCVYEVIVVGPPSRTARSALTYRRDSDGVLTQRHE